MLGALFSILARIVIIGGAVLALWLAFIRKGRDESMANSSKLHAFQYHAGTGLRKGP